MGWSEEKAPWQGSSAGVRARGNKLRGFAESTNEVVSALENSKVQVAASWQASAGEAYHGVLNTAQTEHTDSANADAKLASAHFALADSMDAAITTSGDAHGRLVTAQADLASAKAAKKAAMKAKEDFETNIVVEAIEWTGMLRGQQVEFQDKIDKAVRAETDATDDIEAEQRIIDRETHSRTEAVTLFIAQWNSIAGSDWSKKKAYFTSIGCADPSTATPQQIADAAKKFADDRGFQESDPSVIAFWKNQISYAVATPQRSKEFFTALGAVGTVDLLTDISKALSSGVDDRKATVEVAKILRDGLALWTTTDSHGNQKFARDLVDAGARSFTDSQVVAFLFDGPKMNAQFDLAAAARFDYKARVLHNENYNGDAWRWMHSVRSGMPGALGMSARLNSMLGLTLEIRGEDAYFHPFDPANAIFRNLGNHPLQSQAFLDNEERVDYWFGGTEDGGFDFHDGTTSGGYDWDMFDTGFDGASALFKAAENTSAPGTDERVARRIMQSVVNALGHNREFVPENISQSASVNIGVAITSHIDELTKGLFLGAEHDDYPPVSNMLASVMATVANDPLARALMVTASAGYGAEGSSDIPDKGKAAWSGFLAGVLGASDINAGARDVHTLEKNMDMAADALSYLYAVGSLFIPEARALDGIAGLLADTGVENAISALTGLPVDLVKQNMFDHNQEIVTENNLKVYSYEIGWVEAYYRNHPEQKPAGYPGNIPEFDGNLNHITEFQREAADWIDTFAPEPAKPDLSDSGENFSDGVGRGLQGAIPTKDGQ